MSRIETFTAHNLYFDEAAQVVSDGEQFDPDTYSLMKYGNRAATKAFAADITQSLFAEVPELAENVAAPEFLVAYKTVPPACFYLSRYCLNAVNATRVETGLEPGRLVQVYKNRVTATNYAAATPEARLKELSDIDFSLGGYSVADKPVVILDDIRITGSAEKRILDSLQGASPSVIALGYIAIFDPQQAIEYPGVENELNTSTIRCIDQLLPAILTDNFDLNIRTLKLILSQSQDDVRPEFLRSIPDQLLYNMYYGAIGCGPDFVDAYSGSIQQLQSELKSREHTAVRS